MSFLLSSFKNETNIKIFFRLPVVFFSGEATSVENHGTVIGAMESGKREALRVVEVLAG